MGFPMGKRLPKLFLSVFKDFQRETLRFEKSSQNFRVPPPKIGRGAYLILRGVSVILWGAYLHWPHKGAKCTETPSTIRVGVVGPLHRLSQPRSSNLELRASDHHSRLFLCMSRMCRVFMVRVHSVVKAIALTATIDDIASPRGLMLQGTRPEAVYNTPRREKPDSNS